MRETQKTAVENFRTLGNEFSPARLRLLESARVWREGKRWLLSKISLDRVYQARGNEVVHGANIALDLIAVPAKHPLQIELETFYALPRLSLTYLSHIQEEVSSVSQDNTLTAMNVWAQGMMVVPYKWTPG